MMSVKRLADSVYLFLEKLKGNRSVEEVVVPQSLFGHLTGYAVAGYEIRLYCQKKKYRSQYQRWFCRYFIAYRVFSIASHDAPESLKAACELDIQIPALVPEYVSERIQKEVAIQAYLDLLAGRLTAIAKPA